MEVEIIAGITLDDVLIAIAAIVTAASAVVKAADVIANITPNTADDAFVGGMKRALGKIVKILDRLAINPDADHARKGGQR